MATAITHRASKKIKAKGVTGTAVQQQRLVSSAVKEINKIADSTIEKGYQGLLKIGRLVLEMFFANKVENYRSHDPGKPSSLRSLSEHPDLHVTTSGLYKSINLAIQQNELLFHKISTAGVSASHLMELLSEKSIPRKKKLLEAVVRKKLSVRQLQELMESKRKPKLLPAAKSAPEAQGALNSVPVPSVPPTSVAAENAPDGAVVSRVAAFHLPAVIDDILKLTPKTLRNDTALLALSAEELNGYRKTLKAAIETLMVLQEVLSTAEINKRHSNKTSAAKKSARKS